MKLLLAFPDRDLLRCCARLLQLEGYEPETVFDGAQLVTALRTERPDLVILDMNLPRVESGQILRMLHQEQHIPAVAVTQSGGEEQASRETAAYLVYPFLPEELLNTVERAAGGTKGEEA